MSLEIEVEIGAAPSVFISAEMITVWGRMGNISFVLNTIERLEEGANGPSGDGKWLVRNDGGSGSGSRGRRAVMRASATFYDAADDDVKNGNEEQV